jgi:hypothetical protein
MLLVCQSQGSNKDLEIKSDFLKKLRSLAPQFSEEIPNIWKSDFQIFQIFRLRKELGYGVFSW